MKNIDLKKYKRVFAFGCSFTQYMYPTWANIIHKSMDSTVPFYSLARSGGGNMFIANRLTEANRKYKFDETDLVLLMWSTYCRLDFYNSGDLVVEPSNNFGTGWVTAGNIYSQDLISQEVIKRIGDVNWFLMRDFSVIDLTTTYLENLPCDHIKFMSVPLDFNTYQNLEMGDLSNSIVDTYSFLKDKYPITLFEHMDKKWPQIIKYYDHNHGLFTDYHPSPVDYLNYLQRFDIKLSDASIDYAHDSFSKIMVPNQTKRDIINTFAECDQYISNSYRQAW